MQDRREIPSRNRCKRRSSVYNWFSRAAPCCQGLANKALAGAPGARQLPGVRWSCPRCPSLPPCMLHPGVLGSAMELGLQQGIVSWFRFAERAGFRSILRWQQIWNLTCRTCAEYSAHSWWSKACFASRETTGIPRSHGRLCLRLRVHCLFEARRLSF